MENGSSEIFLDIQHLCRTDTNREICHNCWHFGETGDSSKFVFTVKILHVLHNFTAENLVFFKLIFAQACFLGSWGVGLSYKNMHKMIPLLLEAGYQFKMGCHFKAQ